MYSGYENWQKRGLDALEKRALSLVFRAWLAGKPLDFNRLVFQLKRTGIDVDTAATAVGRLRDDDPKPALLRSSGASGALTPTLAAAIYLLDDPDATELLWLLERLVAYLHETYDPDAGEPDRAQIAARLDTSTARLSQAVSLWRGDDRLGQEPEALFWTSYPRFLTRELYGGHPERLAADPVPTLPISLTVSTIRWMGIGPFARATSLDLTPMTFIVGTNASGKTSTLAVLAALRALAVEGLTIPGLGPRRRTDADEIMLAVDAALERPLATQPDPALTWQLIVSRGAHLHARSETARMGRDELATFERGTGRWRGTGGAQIERIMRPNELALKTAHDPEHQWPLISLRQHLARWWIELSPPAQRDHGLDARWQPYVRDVTARAHLVDAAREIVGIRGLTIGYGVELDDGRHCGPLDVMPRGVVRALEILAVVLAPEPPPLVAIDEIENHLHGDLAARLLDVLRSVSHRTQIVVTTHSARVLRAAHPDEIQLCHRTPHGSAIAPLRAYPHLVRLAEAGDLGALIEGNYFAGMP
jgi:hypothetical protein